MGRNSNALFCLKPIFNLQKPFNYKSKNDNDNNKITTYITVLTKRLRLKKKKDFYESE